MKHVFWGSGVSWLHEIQIKFVLRMLYSITKLFSEKPESRKKWDITSVFFFFFLLLKMGQSGIKSKAKFLSKPSPACTHTQSPMHTNTYTMTVLLL